MGSSVLSVLVGHQSSVTRIESNVVGWPHPPSTLRYEGQQMALLSISERPSSTSLHRLRALCVAVMQSNRLTYCGLNCSLRLKQIKALSNTCGSRYLHSRLNSVLMPYVASQKVNLNREFACNRSALKKATQ